MVTGCDRISKIISDVDYNSFDKNIAEIIEKSKRVRKSIDDLLKTDVI